MSGNSGDERHVTANKKRIDIRGPFFTTVVAGRVKNPK
jgi:O-phosphoseryl-tRNA(Cys) synthetase